MVKKMLNLIMAEYSSLFLQGPSHLQLACVMGERTADEKASFGKIKSGGDNAVSFELTESNVDWLLEQYRDDTFKLLQDCVERSRDKFAREYSKLEATSDWQMFYSEMGVEKRLQRLKFKNFQS